MTDKSLTRARQTAPDIDRHVADIAEMMSRGQWIAPRSHREYALTHGMSVDVVKKRAAEAGRMLRLLTEEDRETLRAGQNAVLGTIIDMALNRVATNPITGEEYPAPDLKAAVSATAERSKLLGLNAPERHEHAHVVAQFEQLPVSGKRERLLEARAKIDAALAALDSELTESVSQ